MADVAVVGVGVLILAVQVQVRLVEEPYLLPTHQGSYPASGTDRLLPTPARPLHHLETRPKAFVPGGNDL